MNGKTTLGLYGGPSAAPGGFVSKAPPDWLDVALALTHPLALAVSIKPEES
jgi:hypothetical protein